MKVPHVRVETSESEAGEKVTLRFEAAGVRVIPGSPRSSRLLRLAGAAVVLAFGIAATANGVGHAVGDTAGLWVGGVAAALGVVGVIAAISAWVLTRRVERTARHDDTPPTIAVDEVSWARSEVQQGRIIVTLAVQDGEPMRFSAVGTYGAQLAQQFGRLLAADVPDEMGSRTTA